MKEVDKAPMNPETRRAMQIFGKSMKDIQNLLSKHPYKFYVILLGRDEDDFVKNYVAENWTSLHYMSGENCLFLSIYPPKKLDPEVANYWKEKLGSSIRKIWKQTPTSGWSYEYARNLGIDFSKLPCLFIGVTLEQQEGFAIKIPEALKNDLTPYFEFIFQKIEDSSKLEVDGRLAALEKKIDEYYSLKLAKIYVKRHWMEYVKPKEIVSTVIGEILARIPGLKSAK
ncbi:MAG: hypothetical protein QG670_1950 [Thermoproteota archaeon]|nr:hypothetical protein [Thermoproteota archaeon]